MSEESGKRQAAPCQVDCGVSKAFCFGLWFFFPLQAGTGRKFVLRSDINERIFQGLERLKIWGKCSGLKASGQEISDWFVIAGNLRHILKVGNGTV